MMRKITLVPLLLALFLLGFLSVSNATEHIIEVGQGGSLFVPGVTNAMVGDTVTFEWVDGDHTTTCDGSTGTSLPGGAATWDEVINSVSTTFSYVLTVAGTYNYKCIPHFPSMVGTINATVSSITQTSSSFPEVYSLNQNFPNPFNPSTSIKFDIVNAGFVKVKVYNNLGKEVSTIVNENLSAGSYQVNWNAAGLTSGVYFYRLETVDYVATKKMLLVK